MSASVVLYDEANTPTSAAGRRRLAAEEAAEDAAFAGLFLVLAGRRLGGGGGLLGLRGPVRRRGGAAAVHGVLGPPLQRRQALPQRAVAGRQLQLVADFGVQALQLVALPRQLGAFARHLQLHVAHLLHQRLFIFLQLPPLLLQLL